MFDVVLVMPAANRFDKVSIRVPNGLLAIAALPVQKGYSVKIIDLKLDPQWRRTLTDSIGPHTICVGITCSTGRMILSALEVARAVREIHSDLPLVWGGPHPTLVAEQTARHPLVDVIVLNEGEETFWELLKALQARAPLSGVKGLVYKEGNNVIFTPSRGLCADFDARPMLPYHLLDLSRYSSLSLHGERSVDLITSRGCPYDCSFCSTPVTSQRHWRAMSVARIMDDIRFLYDEHDVRTFYFADDNFMVDLKRVEAFCDALAVFGREIHWGTQGVTVVTLKQMSDALLNKIAASGCIELSVGVESASPEILKSIHKPMTIEDLHAVNDRLSRHSRIAVKYNMIVGFPGETIEQVKATVQLAVELYQRNPGAWFPFNIFTPFPGTVEFQKAVTHGFRPPERLENWARLESVGWGKYFNYWYGEKETELLESMSFTSYLAFPSAARKIGNFLMRFLFRLYQPFALFRFRHHCYFFHLEKRLFK